MRRQLEGVKKAEVALSTQPIVYPIVPARAIIPVSSRPPAVPAAVAGIMTINKLATLTVALVVVATLPLVALVSESGRRLGQREQQRQHRNRY